jgi:hypothetical protein
MKIIQRLRNIWKIGELFNFNEKGSLEIYADDEKNGLVRTLTTRRNILTENIDKILNPPQQYNYGFDYKEGKPMAIIIKIKTASISDEVDKILEDKPNE